MEIKKKVSSGRCEIACVESRNGYISVKVDYGTLINFVVFFIKYSLPGYLTFVVPQVRLSILVLQITCAVNIRYIFYNIFLGLACFDTSGHLQVSYKHLHLVSHRS